MSRVKIPLESTPDMPLLNTDTIFDGIGGSWYVTDSGQTIANAGLDLHTSFVGTPNSFKSTIMIDLTGRVASNYSPKEDQYIVLYDTETNVKAGRINTLFKKYRGYAEDVVENGNFLIIGKSLYTGEQFWVMLTDMYKAIMKTGKKIKNKIFDVDDYIPTFIMIDSFSDFEPGENEDKVTNDTGKDQLNTLFMKESIWKLRLVRRFASMGYTGGMRFFSTVHLGKEINMGGSIYDKPTKQLKFLKNDMVLKGVSPKYLYLTSFMGMMTNSTILKDSNREPLYPRNNMDKNETDLHSVTMTVIRNKSGMSGIKFNIVVSASTGVQWGLTYFYFIHKELKGVGMFGNNIHFGLHLMPDKKVTRKSVYTELESDRRFFRAVAFTAQLEQLKLYHTEFLELFCTTEELYKDLKEKGYDWDKILNVRGYWSADDSKEEYKHLTIVDLLKMRAGTYKPKGFGMKDK